MSTDTVDSTGKPPEVPGPFGAPVPSDQAGPTLRADTLNLFDSTEDEQNRIRLTGVMDQINNKYGLTTLAPATMLTAFKAAPTRIAFHTIPELF